MRHLRTERGLSTRLLAHRAMCARSTIQRLEQGVLRPRPSLLLWIANGIDPDRVREFVAALTEAAGGPGALAEDGGWYARRARRAEIGWSTGQVPLPADIARRIALHTEASESRRKAWAILDTPGALDDAEALAVAHELLEASRRASEAAGGSIGTGSGLHRVAYGLS